MSDTHQRPRAEGHFWERGTRLTVLIVGSTIAVFLVQLYFAYVKHSAAFDDTFSLSRSGLRAGHYWQLVTYAWLHSTSIVIHILFNLLIIYNLGRALEWPLGALRFLGLYFGSVLAAALVWVAWGGGGPGAGVQGASGAAFGLLAAFATREPRQMLSVWLIVIPMQMTARTLAVLLIGFEALCQLNGWLPFIAHTAHLGGALFGWLYMRALLRRPPPEIGAFSDYKSTPQAPGNG